MAVRPREAGPGEPDGAEPEAAPPDAVRPDGDATAGARLAELRERAAGAYAAVTAADDALRTAAGRRVAAERGVRQALALRQAAQRAAAAHERARPGPLTRLRHPLRGGLDWRRRREALTAALLALEPVLADARRAAGVAGDAFAAQVRVRGEAAAALRRLTAACAAAMEELNACRPHAAPPPGAGSRPDETDGGRVRQ